MTLELIDDGTLDTVFKCDVCNTQERVTINAYLDSDWLSGDEPFADDRIRWSRELVEQEHACEQGEN
ncbi:hypothetical protein LCGC14_1181710 [marine sediment metagenome]|uniref:Uncharacterized protein n=1 Tax=marine sediment metagenome TaxID=412755 RepID=A0A0F9LLX2_9ZZZZ